jgi:hypothetical protein
LRKARADKAGTSVMNPMLRRPFEWSHPDRRPAFGSPVYWAGWTQLPDDSFFD